MWWKILGIESDATLKEVKRAYAKLIKGAYQSGDQEEIIKIQDAYQSGCKYIKSQSKTPKKIFKPSGHKKKNSPNFNFEEDAINYNIDDFKEEKINNTYGEKIKFNIEDKEHINEDFSEFEDRDDYEFHEGEKIQWEDIENDDFICEEVYSHMKNCEVVFDPIYTDMTKRFDIEEWKEFFYNFSFKEEEYFLEHGYKYFNEHYQLPYDIWLVIEENLKLSSKSEFIWKEKLIIDDKLEYYPYEGYSYEELEKLFILRNEACEAYMNLDYDRCLNLCEEAEKINPKEAVIIKLKGLCYFDLGNYKLSYANFEELQGYDKYKVEAKRYMADIHSKNKEFKKAKRLYREILKDNNHVLNSKANINCLKGQKKRLRAILHYKSHIFGNSCDKLLKYKFTSTIEKFVLKNNFFRIHGVYKALCFLIKLFLYGMIGLTIIAICLAILIAIIGTFYKIIIGALVICLIRGLSKKGGK